MDISIDDARDRFPQAIADLEENDELDYDDRFYVNDQGQLNVVTEVGTFCWYGEGWDPVDDVQHEGAKLKFTMNDLKRMINEEIAALSQGHTGIRVDKSDPLADLYNDDMLPEDPLCDINCADCGEYLDPDGKCAACCAPAATKRSIWNYDPSHRDEYLNDLDNVKEDYDLTQGSMRIEDDDVMEPDPVCLECGCDLDDVGECPECWPSDDRGSIFLPMEATRRQRSVRADVVKHADGLPHDPLRVKCDNCHSFVYHPIHVDEPCEFCKWDGAGPELDVDDDVPMQIELDDIFVSAAGGSYSNDREMFNLALQMTKQSKNPEIAKLSQKEVTRLFKQYLRDMEESGDWD